VTVSPDGGHVYVASYYDKGAALLKRRSFDRSRFT